MAEKQKQVVSKKWEVPDAQYERDEEVFAEFLTYLAKPKRKRPLDRRSASSARARDTDSQ